MYGVCRCDSRQTLDSDLDNTYVMHLLQRNDAILVRILVGLEGCMKVIIGFK